MPNIAYELGDVTLPNIASSAGVRAPTLYIVPRADQSPQPKRHISIGSTVLAQLVDVTNKHTQTDAQTHTPRRICNNNM